MAKVTVYGQIPFEFEMEIDDNFLKFNKTQNGYYKEFINETKESYTLDCAYADAWELLTNAIFKIFKLMQFKITKLAVGYMMCKGECLYTPGHLCPGLFFYPGNPSTYPGPHTPTFVNTYDSPRELRAALFRPRASQLRATKSSLPGKPSHASCASRVYILRAASCTALKY